jgi:EAL domain-containing protein (putative c-di-GMP-specific phosphodiesterase class I)
MASKRCEMWSTAPMRANRFACGHQDRTIVEAILHMSHGLGLRTVAEGVETEAQRDALRKLGCQCAQGYLFSRPLPAAEFEAWLMAARQEYV